MYSFVGTASLDQREAETWIFVNVKKSWGVAGSGGGGGDGCWYCSPLFMFCWCCWWFFGGSEKHINTYHIHEGMQYIYRYIQKATLTISLTKGHHVRSPTKDTKEG